MLVRIYAKTNFKGNPDVVVVYLPDFCDFTVDYKLLTGFSVSKLYYSNNLDDKIFVSNSLENDMTSLYNAFVLLYDKNFYFKSVYALSEKYMECYDEFRKKLMPFYPCNEHYFKRFLAIDCFEFSYILYRTTTIDRCKKYLSDFINIYREYLYNIIQYSSVRKAVNIKFDNDQKSLDKVNTEYCKVTEFAEALYDENLSYFIKLEEQHRAFKASNQKYLKALGL